jgi:hypothetical protein
MLFEQAIRLAASRAACTAGKSNAIKTPMIAITTRSSTSVKPSKPIKEGGLEELSLRKSVK